MPSVVSNLTRVSWSIYCQEREPWNIGHEMPSGGPECAMSFNDRPVMPNLLGWSIADSMMGSMLPRSLDGRATSPWSQLADLLDKMLIFKRLCPSQQFFSISWPICQTMQICLELFGMNVNILQDNPGWWWCFPFLKGLADIKYCGMIFVQI